MAARTRQRSRTRRAGAGRHTGRRPHHESRGRTHTRRRRANLPHRRVCRQTDFPPQTDCRRLCRAVRARPLRVRLRHGRRRHVAQPRRDLCPVREITQGQTPTARMHQTTCRQPPARAGRNLNRPTPPAASAKIRRISETDMLPCSCSP